MKRSVLLTCVLLALALAACNGTITSISFPPEAPWQSMETTLLSPTDDLVAVAAGLEAFLTPAPAGVAAYVACGGPSPYLVECFDPACDPLVECGPDPVIDKRFPFALILYLPDVFTGASVQVQDGLGQTVVGLSINLGAAGGGLDLAAGYSEGMIPGVQFSDVDESGHLLLTPDWPAFGFGQIEGEICIDGVCETGVIAQCEDAPSFDLFRYATPAEPGTYSGLCGAVPVTLTVNPAYATVGDCISDRKASACAGLTGQDRKTCNHAQIGICHATFHVPSAHNN